MINNKNEKIIKITKIAKITKITKITNKQRDRDCGPATKYFFILGFHYFLPLNNLVDKCKL